MALSLSSKSRMYAVPVGVPSSVRVNRVRDLRAAAAAMFDYLRRANRAGE